jgi:sec-independent protein translocase protein TatA
MGLGFQELLIVFFIIVLLFGAKKLPELASGLGKGIREFKKASSGQDEQGEKQIENPESKEKAPQS